MTIQVENLRLLLKNKVSSVGVQTKWKAAVLRIRKPATVKMMTICCFIQLENRLK